jgi:catechol 2,3-dioxygenase-like lactoylglutathione lyase family enzyme
VPARIRHIALCVKDIDATADFYQQAFGLKRSPKSEGPTAFRIYMSDGEINLALLQYKSEAGSGDAHC